jgi:hypothetical protein
MNKVLKKTAIAILPTRVVVGLASRRWWKSNSRAVVQSGMREIVQRFVRRYGTTVLHGPFAGLRYPERCAVERYSIPNLLGSYEMELHPWLEQFWSNKHDRIINIGSSEGYYAVGAALRTSTPVDAYETEPSSRRFCREMAELNGVSRLVKVRSWCDRSTLRKLARRRCLIISDCEGFELWLFVPEVIEALVASDLIIELHQGNNSGSLFPSETTRSILEDRFARTHNLQIAKFGPRDTSMFPEVNFLGNDAARAIGEEGRGAGQEWLIATSRS